jgi:predicted nucleotidyltransferase component of viral defense system
MPDIEEPGRAAIVDVDLKGWVEAATDDQVLYRDRRVTEIVLTAIGLAPTLKDALVLKGGTLMALAFDSHRLTADVDFTALLGPAEFEQPLVEELNALLPKAAIQLGHLDLICRVQTLKKMPKPLNFADHDFPALLVRIGSALRGTPEEKRLDAGQATRVLDVEISFKDQVYTAQTLQLSNPGVAVRAFTLHELIAEKFRALLQQPIRNRYRRQDVYDIAYLIDAHPMEESDRQVIYDTLIEKCATRDIQPDRQSLEAEEVVRRAQADWDTLKLEVADLPSFEERFFVVARLYRDLPWPETERLRSSSPAGG